jgi:hypothetical protein
MSEALSVPSVAEMVSFTAVSVMLMPVGALSTGASFTGVTSMVIAAALDSAPCPSSTVKSKVA